MKGKKIFCLLILSVFLSSSAYAGNSKEQDIKKLLEVSGANQIGQQVMKQMINTFKATNPNMPPRMWEEIMKKIDSQDFDNQIARVYDKYLTHEDVKELIKFYESPIGKKLVKVQPQMMQDSMAAGQKWGMKMAQEILPKLLKEQSQELDKNL